MPSRLRVPAGYALFALVLATSRADPRSLLLALPLAALGEAVRIWASGHIDKTRALATGGPYAHTRNPLYLGSLLLGIAVGAACGSLLDAFLISSYLAAFYPKVIAEEAAFLRGKFPNEYAEWARQVPLFLPRLTPAGPRLSQFEWGRVGANREWRTLAALPLTAAVLLARSRFL